MNFWMDMQARAGLKRKTDERFAAQLAEDCHGSAAEARPGLSNNALSIYSSLLGKKVLFFQILGGSWVAPSYKVGILLK